MSPERLEHLIQLVGPLIAKKKCNSRVPIPVAERIVITLRYLATGDSQQSQAFNFRVGRATISNIIRDTCCGIWNALSDTYLSAPESKEEWKKIADDFESQWNFRHCLGALDGKHVAMECPKNRGSSYYNYKGFHNLVLMAMCDANYGFTLVDIGSYVGDNDASIFNQSEMGIAFENRIIDIPDPAVVNGNTLPYVIISDEIFPLKERLMKPYSGKILSEEKLIYNYRLSRCRQTIENAFGILAARWRIFRRPIRASTTTVEGIMKACVCLHNYLLQTDNAFYVPAGFVDAEDETGEIIPSSWRCKTSDETSALKNIGRAGSNNYKADAKAMRENFMTYFNSVSGSVSWQVKHVTSTGATLPSTSTNC
ncbi:putative nuclease HARBI1 [Rhopilema esculentum]|uniref:putative nuclease HARBI1 n=1 Tax=Rhopilema esculentum TaxID=499914 RepID=UPI0031D7F0BA